MNKTLSIDNEQNLELFESIVAHREAEEMIIEDCLKQIFHTYNFYPQKALSSQKLLDLLTQSFREKNFVSVLSDPQTYSLRKLTQYFLNIIEDQAKYSCTSQKALESLSVSKFSTVMLNYLLKHESICLHDFRLDFIMRNPFSFSKSWIFIVEFEPPANQKLLFSNGFSLNLPKISYQDK